MTKTRVYTWTRQITISDPCPTDGRPVPQSPDSKDSIESYTDVKSRCHSAAREFTVCHIKKSTPQKTSF